MWKGKLRSSSSARTGLCLFINHVTLDWVFHDVYGYRDTGNQAHLKCTPGQNNSVDDYTSDCMDNLATADNVRIRHDYPTRMKCHLPDVAGASTGEEYEANGHPNGLACTANRGGCAKFLRVFESSVMVAGIRGSKYVRVRHLMKNINVRT